MDAAQIDIDVDVQSVEKATEAFKRFKAAIDSAAEALARLGGLNHGGVVIRMVGEVMECEVKPAP